MSEPAEPRVSEPTRWKNAFAPFSGRELLLMANVARDWRARLAPLEAELRSQERSVRFAAGHRAKVRKLLAALDARPIPPTTEESRDE